MLVGAGPVNLSLVGDLMTRRFWLKVLACCSLRTVSVMCLLGAVVELSFMNICMVLVSGGLLAIDATALVGICELAK